jgi:hypothetical protein
MNVTFTNQIDEITTEEYSFHFMDSNILYLQSYIIFKKEKKQRFPRIFKKYDRLMNRDNSITEEEVPFTPEIRQRAINEFTSQIKCLKWSERGRR